MNQKQESKRGNQNYMQERKLVPVIIIQCNDLLLYVNTISPCTDYD
jgi:hypothetical protein